MKNEKKLHGFSYSKNMAFCIKHKPLTSEVCYVMYFRWCFDTLSKFLESSGVFVYGLSGLKLIGFTKIY